MNKVTVAAIFIILAAFGGLLVWGSIANGDKIDYSKYNSAVAIEANNDNGNIADHERGKEDSEIIVVEYADTQCEYCAMMMPKMHTMFEEYGDRVKFVYRHFPLSYHQNAIAAAAATESAGLQGYFWEMLEILYDNQSEWNTITDTQKRTNTFAGYFDDITGSKGNREEFINKLNDVNIRKKIDFGHNLGKKIDKVDATPTIFVNGRKAESTNDKTIEQAAEDLINEELKKRDIETGPKEAEEENVEE